MVLVWLFRNVLRSTRTTCKEHCNYGGLTQSFGVRLSATGGQSSLVPVQVACRCLVWVVHTE
jgi:hypothetical protein